MDSRIKIGSPVPEDATIVRGYFDPLLAEDARRLAACPRPLVVMIAEDPDRPPLLPAAARQLLVASLACVDGVIADGAVQPHKDWTAIQQQWREAFEQHVRARSSASS